MSGGVKLYPFPGDPDSEIAVPYYQRRGYVYLNSSRKFTGLKRIEESDLTPDDIVVLIDCDKKAYDELVAEGHTVER